MKVFAILCVFCGALAAPLFLVSKQESSATATAATAGPVDWPVFRGTPELLGVSTEKIAAPLKVAWSFAANGPVTATAAIADGKIFVGSLEGEFYCLHLDGGEKVWSQKLGDEDPIESSACVVGGRVYVGSGDGNLYCLDVASGKVVWKLQTDGEILGGINYYEKDGKTYVYAGSYDNFLYCVDAVSGKKLWAYESGNYVNGTPTVADGKVMFGGCDGVLYILDAVSGKEVGQAPIDSYIANSVAVESGVAYIAHYGNEAMAVRLHDRETLWRFHDREFPYFASPSVSGETVLVAGRGKRLYALDKATGKKKWQFKGRHSMDSSPVVSGGVIYVGGDDGRLYAIDLKSGKELWSYEIGEAIKASPAISGGKLVIGAEDGKVYAFVSAS